jgi:hypothetical protein
MQKFIHRASDFLSFGRAFVGLLEDEKSKCVGALPTESLVRRFCLIPEGILTRAMRSKEVLWADDASDLHGANQQILKEFNVRQLLAVPFSAATDNC